MRRVLAAMVLAPNSNIAFLDEPSSGMYIESKYILWSSVRKQAGLNTFSWVVIFIYSFIIK